MALPFNTNLARVSVIATLAIAWLTLPFLLFALTFFKFYLFVAIVAIVYYFSTPISWDDIRQIATKEWLRNCLLIAALAALMFVWLTGIFPPFFFTGDWIKSFSLMNLLVQSDTLPPILYKNDEPGFLRYNVWLYLLPALLQKNVYPLGLDIWYGLYELMGVTLVYLLVIEAVHSPSEERNYLAPKNLIIILVFMGFSGADSLGELVTDRPPMGPVGFNHIEWWDQNYSFSALCTQLLWTPQHCLPAWLGVILLYLNERFNGRVLNKSIFLLGGLLSFASPLVFAGFVALMPLYLKRLGNILLNWRMLSMVTLLGLVIVLPMVIYYSTSAGSIPQWWRLSADSAVIKGQLWFLTLEVFLWIFILNLVYKNDVFVKRLLLCIIVLSVLVISYNFGGTNELPLKAMMPASALLSILVTTALMNQAAPTARNDSLKIALLVLFLAGLFTPVFEYGRFFLFGRDVPENFEFTKDKELMDDAHFNQYFGWVREAPFFIKLDPSQVEANKHE